MTDRRILRALVTGASSGIGEAFARQLASRGVATVVVARREPRLRTLATELPTATEVLVADLGTRDGLARVETRLASRDAPVDLLVNAAGLGAYGDVAGLGIDEQQRLVDVNVTAVLRLTRAVLPQLLERATGGVVNVGSLAGFQPDPHGAVYGATKAFVRSFTEALHEELADTGVHALLLAPGFTSTEFSEVAGGDDAALPSLAVGDVDAVVVAALDAFARRRPVCVPAPLDRVASLASQMTPSALSRKVSAKVHERVQRAS